MKPHRLSVLLTISLLLILIGGALAQATAERYGTVSWISDGDTITVDGVGVVRLIGIDCPEKEESDRDWKFLRLGSCDWQTLRHVAQSARQRTKELCLHQTVQLQTGEERFDRYGRLLAYVWLPDGRMLNQLLLEEGQAIVYRRFEFTEKENFLTLEKKARSQQRGLWRLTKRRS